MSKSPKHATGKSQGKSASSQLEATGEKKRAKKKTSTMGTGMMFRSAIKRIARGVSPDNNIMLTSNSIQVLCAIAYDFVETTAGLSGEMARKIGKQTVGSDDVIAAFEIILKGELRKLALREVHTTLAKTQVKPHGK